MIERCQALNGSAALALLKIANSCSDGFSGWRSSQARGDKASGGTDTVLTALTLFTKWRVTLQAKDLCSTEQRRRGRCQFQRHIRQVRRRSHGRHRCATDLNRHTAENPAGADVDPLPARLNGRAGAAIDDHLLAGADVELLAGVEGVTGHANVPVADHHQVIVLSHFGLALTVGDAFFVSLELMAGGAGDDDAALVVDLHC